MSGRAPIDGLTAARYQGVVCKHGHSGIRYRSSHACVVCVREAQVVDVPHARAYHRYWMAKAMKDPDRARQLRAQNAERQRRWRARHSGEHGGPGFWATYMTLYPEQAERAMSGNRVNTNTRMD